MHKAVDTAREGTEALYLLTQAHITAACFRKRLNVGGHVADVPHKAVRDVLLFVVKVESTCVAGRGVSARS
jgi:hypothetical protein